MKKLWKQEWKRYLFFTLATLLCLFIRVPYVYDSMVVFDREYYMTMIQSGNDAAIIGELEGLARTIGELILSGMVWEIAIILFLQRALLFRLEREEYGRSFLQTLPVKRKERAIFRIEMDCLMIVLCVAVFSGYIVMRVAQTLAYMEIWIPWLTQAVLGMAATAICYLFLVEGLIAFWSTLFVSGTAKITGTIAAVGMQMYTVSLLFDRSTGTGVGERLYGFLFLKAVGNCYYVSDFPDRYDLSRHWIHGLLNPPVYHKGVLWDIYTKYDDVDSSLSRLYDFTHLSSYMGYAFMYLCLAMLLLLAAVWLSNRQELSCSGFYFSFGKYLFSILFSLAFFVTSFSKEGRAWQKGLACLATLLVFIILIYVMSGKLYRHLEKTKASG